MRFAALIFVIGALAALRNGDAQASTALMLAAIVCQLDSHRDSWLRTKMREAYEREEYKRQHSDKL